MEISFDSKNIEIYKELYSLKKEVQLSAESVVPDTDDDIAKTAAVQSSVLLKSKDVTARGVIVSGEAVASLMYINENQDKVSFVKLSKSFTIEYEIPDAGDDMTAQIKLSLVSAEARVINPRKVAVSFEICGELSCYVPESVAVETGYKPDSYPGLHAKYESCEVSFINAVCEKTFSLNEQFSFPGGKPKPSRLVSCNTEFVVNDSQFVGTKAIIKGTAFVNVCYLSDEVNYPVKAEFSTTFSQIVDIGEEDMENCVVNAALTGMYYELADSINGDKLIDVELYAVLQLLCRCKREILYVSDVYSNLMPVDFSCEKNLINAFVEKRKIKISTDERLNIMDDCADVLSIFVSFPRLMQEQSKIKAALNLDVIYRTNSGLLSSARRGIEVEAECGVTEFKIADVHLSDIYLRPDGQYLDAHFSLEVGCLLSSKYEIDKVVTVTMDENAPIALEAFPSLTLVRCAGESLWELAKTYHSSVETISASNDLEKELDGRMVLIPKSI